MKKRSTIFRRINALGAEADNVPLNLFDFNEIEIYQVLAELERASVKSRACVIYTGAFIRQHMVYWEDDLPDNVE